MPELKDLCLDCDGPYWRLLSLLRNIVAYNAVVRRRYLLTLDDSFHYLLSKDSAVLILGCLGCC